MAQFDAFLKLDGIKGESADAGHKGEIDILHFRWDTSQVGSHATGGGGGTGRVRFSAIHFVKRADASSPLLLLNCANGAHIKEANVTVRKAGGTQLEYLKIKLTDVLISKFIEHGKPVLVTNSGVKEGPLPQRDPIPVPLEEISLSFSRIEYQYQPQGADGKAQGGPLMAGWDLKQNKAV